MNGDGAPDSYYTSLTPEQVKDGAFMFGVSSDKSEAAKALLYPRPSDAEMEVIHILGSCMLFSSMK